MLPNRDHPLFGGHKSESFEGEDLSKLTVPSSCVINAKRFPFSLTRDVTSDSLINDSRLIVYGGLGEAQMAGRSLGRSLGPGIVSAVDKTGDWLSFYASQGRIDLILRELKEILVIRAAILNNIPIIATIASEVSQSRDTISLNPDPSFKLSPALLDLAKQGRVFLLPVVPGGGHVPLDIDPPEWRWGDFYLREFVKRDWNEVIISGGDISNGMLETISYFAPVADRFKVVDPLCWSNAEVAESYQRNPYFLPSDERWLLQPLQDGFCMEATIELMLRRYDTGDLSSDRELGYLELANHFRSLSGVLQRPIEFEVATPDISKGFI